MISNDILNYLYSDEENLRNILLETLAGIKSFLSVKENDYYIYTLLVVDEIQDLIPCSVWKNGEYSTIEFVYKEIEKYFGKKFIPLVFNEQIKIYIRNNVKAKDFLLKHPELSREKIGRLFLNIPNIA